MIEMILQSHENELHLLPALPDAWRQGEVKGLKARGGFEVDLVWNQNRLQTASIQSFEGSVCVIRSAIPISVQGVKAKIIKSEVGYIMTFPTAKNKIYHVTAKK